MNRCTVTLVPKLPFGNEIKQRGRLTFCTLNFALFIAIAGCGQVEHAEVTGKVTLDGTPMNNVRLSFLGDLALAAAVL